MIAETSQKNGWMRTGTPRRRNLRSYADSANPTIVHLGGHAPEYVEHPGRHFRRAARANIF